MPFSKTLTNLCTDFKDGTFLSSLRNQVALVPSDFARISRRGIVHFTLIFFRTVLAYLPYKVQHKCNKCGIH